MLIVERAMCILYLLNVRLCSMFARSSKLALVEEIGGVRPQVVAAITKESRLALKEAATAVAQCVS